MITKAGGRITTAQTATTSTSQSLYLHRMADAAALVGCALERPRGSKADIPCDNRLHNATADLPPPTWLAGWS